MTEHLGELTARCTGCVGLARVEERLAALEAVLRERHTTETAYLSKIERLLERQNGRIGGLENWRWGLTGGMVLAAMLAGWALAAAKLIW